jgi:hypothetical protein
MFLSGIRGDRIGDQRAEDCLDPTQTAIAAATIPMAATATTSHFHCRLLFAGAAIPMCWVVPAIPAESEEVSRSPERAR